MTYAAFIKPYQQHLDRIDQTIKKTLLTVVKQDQRHYLTHVLSQSGKRLRPMLGLLIFVGYKGHKLTDKVYYLMSAIELVHVASLIHDDVIDKADSRRGQVSVNKEWGNSTAVVLGVYVYSQSLSLIHQSGDMSVLGYFSRVVRLMCEGELFQLRSRQDMKLSLLRYYRVIYCKTASLFSAAFWIGSYLADCSDDDQRTIKQIGLRFGFLYQFVDDLLDILDEDNFLNKKRFQDLENGQLTYPFILYYKLAGKDAYDLSQLRSLTATQFVDEMKKYDVISRCFSVLRTYELSLRSKFKLLSQQRLRYQLGFVLDFVLKRVDVKTAV